MNKRREPVMVGVVSVDVVVAALVSVLTEFGVIDWSTSQVASVMTLASVLAALLVRSRVTPVDRGGDDLV